MSKIDRQQRQANRQAKKAMKKAKFQQSKLYQAFHREKPKGDRGYQVISKSKTGGLTGRLGLKEKLQDIFTKEGHTDCPSWGVNKDGTCRIPEDKGKRKTTTVIGGNTYTTSDDDEKKKSPFSFDFAKYKLNIGLNINKKSHDAMTPFTLGDALSKQEWRREEKRPMKKLKENYLSFEDWSALNKANVLDRIRPEDESRLDKEMSKHGVTPDDVAESMTNENKPNQESDGANTNTEAKKKGGFFEVSITKLDDDD